MSESGRGRVKTLTLDCAWKFLLDLVDVKVVCAGNIGRKKEIEKTIFAFSARARFSHSRGQKAKYSLGADVFRFTLNSGHAVASAQ
jgi:hypothetical protein